MFFQPIWLKKAGLDIEGYNTLIINTGGDGSIKYYKEILDLWKIPTFLVCDGRAKKKYPSLIFEHRFDLKNEDFFGLVSSNYPTTTDEFIRKYGGSKPIVAALVALKEEPPEEIRELASKLKAFLV
ncbi:MAG: TOPRIM nucleotidyl transferase/hydrolase domain-containing protein [Nitrososphaerales archaeon]